MNDQDDTYTEQFRDEGFIAPVLEDVCRHHREMYPEEFSLAFDVNRLAQKLYMDSTLLVKGLDRRDAICLGLQIVPRCLSAYQGALLLAQRGMNVEALTLARSIYEAAFWLGYLEKAPGEAVPALFGDTIFNELRLLKASKKIPLIDATTVSLIDGRIAEYEKAIVVEGYPNKSVSIPTLASKSGMDSVYPQYRQLCGEAAHTSLKSILQYVNVDDDGQNNGYVIGPDKDIPRTLVYCIWPMIMVIEAIRMLADISTHDDAFESLMARYNALISIETNSVTA